MAVRKHTQQKRTLDIRTTRPLILLPPPTLAPIPACRNDQVYRNTYVCNLCLLTLTVSFVADLYPGSPSHNVPMSAALLWACSNVDAVRALRRRSFAYALSVVVLVSLFMDVDFLASDLKVRPRSARAESLLLLRGFAWQTEVFSMSVCASLAR